MISRPDRKTICLYQRKQMGDWDGDATEAVGADAAAAARVTGDAAPPLRQAKLPVRGRRAAARDVGAEHSEGGRTRVLTLTEADVPAVAAALDRYRAAQAELQAQAKAGLAALADRIRADRAAGRRPRRGR